MSLLDSLSFNLGKSEFLSLRVKIYADMSEAIADQESVRSVLQKRINRAAEAKKNVHLVYRKWLANLATGVSLADAAKHELPAFDYMVLSTFERAGKIEEGMRFLSSSLGKLKNAKKVMRKALLGPALVLSIAVAMITGFSLYVVPMITSIYPPERWPTMGKILYAVSNVIKNYGLGMAFLFVVTVSLVTYSLPRLRGPFRLTFDKWPIYASYRRINGLTTLIGLAAQLKVGVSLKESVRQLGAENTPYMKWMLSRVLSNLNVAPDGYGRAFDIGLFDEEIMFRLVDFAERSSFPRAVEKVGMESFDEVIKGMEEAAEIASGIAKAIAGAIITFVIVSFLITSQGIKKDVQSQLYSTH